MTNIATFLLTSMALARTKHGLENDEIKTGRKLCGQYKKRSETKYRGSEDEESENSVSM